MTGNSIINLGDLSKPATILIEKVSDAVGGIAKPWQIKRVASAEAEAEKIRALTQVEITEIQKKALVRMVHEEGVKQRNIEDITVGAIPHLDKESDPSRLEEDWLAYFFDKSRLVSNPDMQSIWSRILAGEANQANSFSKRTVELVATLSRSDAEIFTALCSMVWNFGILEPVFKYDDDIFREKFSGKLIFSKLRHLNSIGLISFSTSAENIFNFSDKAVFIDVYYFGTQVRVELVGSGANKPLYYGNVSLTQAGKELATIAGATPNHEYFLYILEKWINSGHIVSTPIVAKENWLHLMQA
ncbi:DUF2806 domain-containing protein [Agrobacterium leguminum]